jgi:hypothetical protein
MATPVSICSLALHKLGAKPISSLTESTDMAALCNATYEAARDSFLRAHPWNSCIKRIQLAAETTAPVWGYSSSHLLPGDFIRLLEVYEVRDYTVENKRVLCDETPIQIRYVFQNDDTASWDALMVELMTQKMIAELAYAVTRSDTKAQAEMQKYVAMLKQARTIDAQEEPAQQIEASAFISTRF